jgi:hypothetical protein
MGGFRPVHGGHNGGLFLHPTRLAIEHEPRETELKRLKHAPKIGVRSAFCESAIGRLGLGLIRLCFLALFKSEQNEKARLLFN